MSKRNRREPTSETEPRRMTIAGEQWVTMAEHEEALAELARLRNVEPPAAKSAVKVHLRCPACWNGLGGRAFRETGRYQINASKHRRYYQCDQCGTQWYCNVDILEDDHGVVRTTMQLAGVRTPAETA